MKTLLLALTIGMTLSASTAVGQLLVFTGTSKLDYTGESHRLRLNPRVYAVVDHETTQVANILYYSVNGVKRYRVNTYTNLHELTATGVNGARIGIISEIPSDCESSQRPNSESVFASGPVTALAVNTNVTIQFARTLTSSGRGVFYGEQSGLPIYSEGSLTVGFNKKESQLSNQIGEKLNEAVTRISLHIEAQGYIREQ